MPKYIKPSGTAAVAICGRCKVKRPYDNLMSDPNTPGLMVCADRPCADDVDPYRLPQRAVEQIALIHPRPDNDLATTQVEADNYKSTFGDSQ